jgi:hypothetical protein
MPYVRNNLGVDVVGVSRETFDSEGYQISTLPRQCLELNALIEIVLSIYLVIRVVKLESLGVERMQFDFGIVDCVLKTDGIIVCCAPERLSEADLDHIRSYKEVCFHAHLLLFI